MRRVVGELGDHPARRRRGLAREDDRLDVPVGREADVVELDLVEARACRDLGDRDVVVPDPLVVRVRPAETGLVAPDRAVPILDRQLRLAVGKTGSSKMTTRPDQVDALPVDEPRRFARLVVRLRGPNCTRERHRRGEESDLAVLVLDIELDRVHALRRRASGTPRASRSARRAPSSRGSREPPRQRARRPQAPLSPASARLRGGLARRGGRVRRGVVSDHESRTGGHGCGHTEQEADDDRATPPASPARCLTPRTEALVRLHLLEQHRHGRGNAMWKTSLSQAEPLWITSRKQGNRRISRVVLSDRTIRRLLGEGRIEIEPSTMRSMQPS